MKQSLYLQLTIFIAVIGLSLWSPSARGYSRYHNPAEATQGCVQCHSGFPGPGPLHTTHTSMRSGTCLICHWTSTGDDPYTYQSGGTGGLNQGCRGCHGVNNGTTYGWGAGLRAHHKNAGAPADSDGHLCAFCHTSDPAPSPESTQPVYYTNSVVRVKTPCLARPAPPGEDYDGDGKGLDNNGNLVYDENENECSFRITAIAREGDDLRVTWQSAVGVTNFLQASSGDSSGHFNTNFVALGTALVTSGSVVTVTNRLDVGGATNMPARYYRVRRP